MGVGRGGVQIALEGLMVDEQLCCVDATKQNHADGSEMFHTESWVKSSKTKPILQCPHQQAFR
jgi:hypothetical protein